MRDDRRTREPRKGWAWHLLLVIPFVATLWVPFYNALEPTLFGFPFFYWYQFLWIAISAALTGVVYFATGTGRGSKRA